MSRSDLCNALVFPPMTLWGLQNSAQPASGRAAPALRGLATGAGRCAQCGDGVSGAGTVRPGPVRSPAWVVATMESGAAGSFVPVDVRARI